MARAPAASSAHVRVSAPSPSSRNANARSSGRAAARCSKRSPMVGPTASCIGECGGSEPRSCPFASSAPMSVSVSPQNGRLTAALKTQHTQKDLRIACVSLEPEAANVRKLRRQDSNLNCLNQNQKCCRLHHDGSLDQRLNRVHCRRRCGPTADRGRGIT